MMFRSGKPAELDVELIPPKWIPRSEHDIQEIRAQLARILESLPFKMSKRCPALLTHVVEKTLQGRSEDLKERTLGIEVFHRDPHYDTNVDPVVRIAASEVRKRLAQYYYQPGHSREIRIELPSGSYAPEFYRFVDDETLAAALPEAFALQLDPANAELRPSPIFTQPTLASARKKRWLALLPIGCLLLGLFAGVAADRMRGRVASAPITPLDEFWRPLINAPGTVWLCLGEAYAVRVHLEPNGARNRFSSAFSLTPNGQKAYPTLNLVDTTVLARLAGYLVTQNKEYSVHGESETTFSDLASGPSVLIGSFNNDWSIRLSDQLRYHFEMNPDTKEEWIVDREKPTEKIGVHTFNLAAPDTHDAYAIISRVRDPSTGQMVVALAGVAMNGTQAAGTFVFDPQYLEQFAKQAPANWQNSSLQIVIAAPIVDGSVGRPRIVSTYVW